MKKINFLLRNVGVFVGLFLIITGSTVNHGYDLWSYQSAITFVMYGIGLILIQETTKAGYNEVIKKNYLKENPYKFDIYNSVNYSEDGVVWSNPILIIKREVKIRNGNAYKEYTVHNPKDKDKSFFMRIPDMEHKMKLVEEI